MSDTEAPPRLTEEDIANIVSRDSRLRVFQYSLDVQHELENSKVIKALMSFVRDEADRAMDALADTSPADQSTVALHLVKVSTLVYIRRVLTAIMRQGEAAEAAIRAEDDAMRVHERHD